MRIKDSVKAVLFRLLPDPAFQRIVVLYWKLKNRNASRYEPEIRMLPALVRAGDVVVDIGVNMGQYASRLSSLVGPEGLVMGFEALPRTWNLATRIVNFANVRVQNFALSDSDGTVELEISSDPTGMPNLGVTRIASHTGGESAGGVRVEATTLDSSMKDKAGRVAFIKCDVEGHEVEVFRGAVVTIGKSLPAILVETNAANFTRLNTQLSPLGYNSFVCTPAGSLEPLTSPASGVFNCFFLTNRHYQNVAVHAHRH